MNWASLYSPRRTGDPVRKDANPDRLRTSYLRDYDRIIFSSAFRRLQNKTQVFPLPGAVFVHNRLTHSLEVASVGRSLGRVVGDALAEKHFSRGGGSNSEEAHSAEFYRYELQNVIAAACLAHDIGNPPFGHSGEDSIRTFFTELEGESGRIIRDGLSDIQRLDFERFEGNSNAFRILTHPFGSEERGGYKLTGTTLAALVKYPCSSADGFDKSTGWVSTKKSGFFCSEEATFREIAETLGVPAKAGGKAIWARHPFVFLTEAADDLCYRVIDLEDAHRLRILSYDEFCGLFLPFFEGETGYSSADYIAGKLAKLTDDNQKVQYLRAVWIGLMTRKLAEAFLAQEDALLDGTLEHDLLKCLPERECALIKAINDFSVRRIYHHASVLQVEVAGYHVIGGLLREFVDAIVHPKRSKSGKTRMLLPRQYVTGKGLYEDLQAVVDFISGMTDLYAIDLYRKMTGITVTSAM